MVVVDDHPLVRRGVISLVSTAPGLLVVAEAEDEESALEAIERERPDIVLMDLRLKRGNGINVMATLRQARISTNVIVYTSYDDEQHVYDAIAAGARGYVFKTSDPVELMTAISIVRGGGRYVVPEALMRLAEHVQIPDLTAREREVLTLLARGRRNRDIAEVLHITGETVKGHLKKILIKLGAVTRTEAVRKAIERGIVRLD